MATYDFHDLSRLSTREIYSWMVQLIIPRPIAWISSQNAEGVVNLAPFSFFNGVCSQPPTLAISITRLKGGEKKDTLRNLEANGEFVVNTSSWNERLRINQTSGLYAPEVSEANLTGVTLLPSHHVKCPRVAESHAQFECQVSQIVEIGENAPGSASLVLGRILGIHVNPAILRDGKVDPALLDPASRLGGSHWSALGAIDSLPRVY